MLTAVLFLHEYILKRIIPYNEIEAEAVEAARHSVGCFFFFFFFFYLKKKMGQEDLNRNDMLSLQWNTENQTTKCDINTFSVIKLEQHKWRNLYNS